MSKHQTRRSISLTRELYDRLLAFGAEHAIPASQVVTQGIEAIMRGDIVLAPAVDPAVVSKRTSAARRRPA